MRTTSQLPQSKGIIYVTTNFEIGATDLLHYHDKTHLSFIVNGGVIDKRNNAETEKTSGELMFFYQGEPHQSIYQRFPSTCVNLELNLSFFQDSLSDETILKTSVENYPNTKFTMLKIYKELLVQDAFSDCSIEMLISSLIENKCSVVKIRPAWVDNVRELVNDCWNEPLSLKDISIAAGVHPVTISKLFPKYFSCTFGEYMRRLKIEKSLQMIKNTSASLSEIAYECGFYDQSHFTRTFKHLTGFLPNAYTKL